MHAPIQTSCPNYSHEAPHHRTIIEHRAQLRTGKPSILYVISWRHCGASVAAMQPTAATSLQTEIPDFKLHLPPSVYSTNIARQVGI